MRIVCPACRQRLIQNQEQLRCSGCERVFPTRNGIPDLYLNRTSSELSDKVELANIDHYDRNVVNFQKNVIRDRDEDYDYEKATLKELSGTGKDRILDIGTGTGKILQIAAPFYKDLYGIDVSIEMLQPLKAITPHVARASVLCLPFEDNFFDVTTAHSVLHHIIDIQQAFQEIFRTLKPGGVFYSDTDANRAFVDRFKWFLDMRRRLKGRLFKGNQEIERLSDYYHSTGLDPEELKDVILSAGFQEVEIRYHFPPNPDEFTKLIMELDRYKKNPSHYYYFVMIARKG